jgi:hypothetical protein
VKPPELDLEILREGDLPRRVAIPPKGLTIGMPALGPAIFSWHLDRVQGNPWLWKDVQEQWNRYSAALKFDSGIFGPEDQPPFSINLCLYSVCREVGSAVEITGLKLERAYDQDQRYPTAFGPDWTVFSASKDPDPVRPGFFLFER